MIEIKSLSKENKFTHLLLIIGRFWGESPDLAISDTDSLKTMHEAKEEYIAADEASLRAHDTRIRKNPTRKK